MDKQSRLEDLRFLVLRPKKYGMPPDYPTETMARGTYWRKTIARYDTTMKRLRGRCYHWYVITYIDGRQELAYLRVLKLGIAPAIYRGLIPRLLSTTQYANIKNIRLAF